jgi:hypothetical protein
VLRLATNCTALWLMWAAVAQVAPATNEGDHRAATHYAGQTIHALATNRMAQYAAWMMLGSTALWMMAYAHHRHHLIRIALHDTASIDTKVPHSLYTLCHVSILNFALDIPDLHVPTNMFSHYVILALNVVAGSVFVVAFTLQQPMAFAWGCYAPNTPIKDLDFGVCPRFIDNAQDVLPPVCDQPGVLCGEGVQVWKGLFAHDIHVAGSMVFASFLLYLPLTLDARVRFYETEHSLLRDNK